MTVIDCVYMVEMGNADTDPFHSCDRDSVLARRAKRRRTLLNSNEQTPQVSSARLLPSALSLWM